MVIVECVVRGRDCIRGGYIAATWSSTGRFPPAPFFPRDLPETPLRVVL